MPKGTILQGYAADVLDMEPSAATLGKPGKTLILLDKNSGDTVIFTVDNEEASRIGMKLLGNKVRKPTELETDIITGGGRVVREGDRVSRHERRRKK